MKFFKKERQHFVKKHVVFKLVVNNTEAVKCILWSHTCKT